MPIGGKSQDRGNARGGLGGGGASRGGGSASSGGKMGARSSQRAAGASESMSGPGRGGALGGGGPGSSDGRHRNRLSEIERVARATGTSTQPVGNTGVSKAGRVSSALQGMARDYRDVGNTTMENIGNRLAGMFGFNQQRPTMQAAMDRVNQTPAGSVTDRRAGWGFDPAGLMGGLAGMAAGIPFGTGLLADQISARFGRPMEIGMGPSVFGGYGGVNTASSPGGFQGGGTGMANSGAAPLPQWGGGVLAPQQQAANPWGPPAQTQQNMWAQPWPGQGVLSPNQKQWSWGSWG